MFKVPPIIPQQTVRSPWSVKSRSKSTHSYSSEFAQPLKRISNHHPLTLFTDHRWSCQENSSRSPNRKRTPHLSWWHPGKQSTEFDKCQLRATPIETYWSQRYLSTCPAVFLRTTPPVHHTGRKQLCHIAGETQTCTHCYTRIIRTPRSSMRTLNIPRALSNTRQSPDQQGDPNGPSGNPTGTRRGSTRRSHWEGVCRGLRYKIVKLGPWYE